MFWFGFAIVLLVFVGVFGVMKLENNRVARAWQEVAGDRDFVFMKPGMFDELEMSGTDRGVSVRVHTETRKTGADNYSTFTVFGAALPDGVPDDLRVDNQSMLSIESEELERSDFRSDDSAVDREFFFESDPPEEIEKLLELEEVHDAFRRLASSNLPVRIEDGTIIVESDSRVESRAMLGTALDTVMEFARDLDEAIENAPASWSPRPASERDDAFEPVVSDDTDDARAASSDPSEGDDHDTDSEDDYVVEW